MCEQDLSAPVREALHAYDVAYAHAKDLLDALGRSGPGMTRERKAAAIEAVNETMHRFVAYERARLARGDHPDALQEGNRVNWRWAFASLNLIGDSPTLGAAA